MNHLNYLGINNSGIIDRFWFHSLYFRDPDGNLLEIATKKPGYAADESPDEVRNKSHSATLGRTPAQRNRKGIESLKTAKTWRTGHHNIRESPRHLNPWVKESLCCRLLQTKRREISFD